MAFLAVAAHQSNPHPCFLPKPSFYWLSAEAHPTRAILAAAKAIVHPPPNFAPMFREPGDDRKNIVKVHQKLKQLMNKYKNLAAAEAILATASHRSYPRPPS